MDKTYERLFERTYINKLAVKNRLVMCPMGTHSDEADGYLSETQMDYYEERAKGGPGMIIVEGQFITNRTDPWMYYSTVSDTNRQTKMWRQLSERIKPYGAKMCLQLTCGLGRCGFPAEGSDAPLISASENHGFYIPSQITRPMTVDEIHDVVGSYARGAIRAKMAGADAVEIHGHVGYLLDQFMSSCWNRRTDEYGGSFENRMRFITEIVQEMRKAVGPDFPILFRLAVDHRFQGGRTLADGLEIIKYLDSIGVDAFDVDAGCYDAHEWICPPAYLGDACMVDVAAAVKKVTDKPVLNTGNFTPETAVQAVEDGVTDFIMLGRGLIADPDWANKVYTGHRDDLCPCIRCNQFCIGNLEKGCIVSCSVNAAAGAERQFRITRTDLPKTVVVVGGGPGGMEAARVAALKGHRVSLYEKSGILGGQITAAATPSFKAQLKAYIEYLESQIKKLGVEIHLNTAITADSEELKNIDQIIVAVGGTPILPKIKGIEAPNVIEATDAHLYRRAELGKDVIVAGGGLSGCDLALELAMEGKNVTIVEMLDKIAAATNLDNKLCLNRMLKQYGASALTSHKILEFTDNGVKVEDSDGNTKSLSADTVILAFGTRPDRALANSICDKYPTAKMIGDCEKVRQVGDAVREGFFAAWSIQ